ncbi:MAG: response regulator [Pseudomonadota bacterium]|nr:response regulator [Pseudomonadota bacterium]
MNQAQNILNVEDDVDIRSQLDEYMTQAGFRTVAVENVENARRAIRREDIALVLLDLGLPGEDGLSLAREIKNEYKSGLIILNGRGEVVDRVVGLELGADDYIAKPYHLREVLARSRSVLRRLEVGTQSDEKESKVKFGRWNFDLMRRTLVSTSDNQEIRLTTLEFQLLEAFLQNHSRVLSRERLLDFVTGRKWDPYDRAIDVQVARLRRKIEDDPRKPELTRN